MPPYQLQRIAHYLVAIYCETKHNLLSYDINWQLDTQFMQMTMDAAVYSELKPYIDSQSVLYRLKQTVTEANGKSIVVMAIENPAKMIRLWDGKAKISDL